MPVRQKKKGGIVVLVLALALSASFTDVHAATEIFWDGGGSDNYWTTAENWAGDVLPTSDATTKDYGMVNDPSADQPLVDAAVAAIAYRVVVGQNTGPCTLTVTGGSITSSGGIFTIGRESNGIGILNISGGDVIADEGFIIANLVGSTGTVNISGGTITVQCTDPSNWYRHFVVGDHGTATLNMSGGVINAGNDMYVSHGAASVGTVNMAGGMINVTGEIRLGCRSASCGFYLDGGVVTAANLLMDDNGALDIIDGVMILDDDKVRAVQEYVGWGLITGYGFLGAVTVDYNVTNAGKTTLMADPAFKPALLSNIQFEGDDTAMTAIGKVLKGLSDGQDAAPAIYQLACACRRLYQYNKSCEVYQYIVDNWPQSVHAVYSLSNIVISGIRNERIEEAEAAAKKLLIDYSSHPESVRAARLLADKYRKLGRFAEARELYQNIVNTWPTNEQTLWAHRDAAIANFRLGNDDAANLAVEKIMANFPQDNRLPRIISAIAWRCRTLERYSQARHLFEMFIKNWPDHKDMIKVYRELILAYIGMGDDKAADEAIIRVVSNYSDYPGYPRFVFVTAEGYYKEFQKQKAVGYEEQARVYLERAQKTWGIVVGLPEFQLSSEATLYLADCHRLLGHPEQALAYYQKVVDEYPDFEYAWHAQFMVGHLYDQLQHTGIITKSEADAEKRHAYEKLLVKYPDCKAAKAASDWLDCH